MEINSLNQRINPSEAPVQPVLNPVNKKIGFLPMILVGLLLLVVVGIGAYYLGTQKNNLSNKDINMEPNPTNQITPTQSIDSTINTQKTERIILQEDYYFDITIPKGYSLKEGFGDYAKYIVDSDGKKLIGFLKSSGGGELSSRRSPITIDGVPLVIMYRKDIGCPLDIFSEKAEIFQKMYFGIVTWCKDEKDTQLPVYKQVIESVIFGPKLRQILLGNSPAPSLQIKQSTSESN